MTLLPEGLMAMRGCWRLLWRDPAACEDFNLTIEGFWRSFAMVLPVMIIAYFQMHSLHAFSTDWARVNGESEPVLNIGAEYFYLLVNILIWPFLAAILAWLLGVGENYVRYMIIYNWMTIPVSLAATGIINLVHFMVGVTLPASILVSVFFYLLLYVSWYVAKVGLRTTASIAVAFMLADYALTYALAALIR